MLIVIGLLMVVVTSIIVRIFDDTIRVDMWRKRLVIFAMFTGLSFIISGIISWIVK